MRASDDNPWNDPKVQSAMKAAQGKSGMVTTHVTATLIRRFNTIQWGGPDGYELWVCEEGKKPLWQRFGIKDEKLIAFEPFKAIEPSLNMTDSRPINWTLDTQRIGPKVNKVVNIKEEPVPTRNAGSKELDEALDRPSERPHAAWVDDREKQKIFFAEYTRLCEEYAVPSAQREPLRKQTLVKHSGQDSLKGWNDTANNLLGLLKQAILDEGYVKDAPPADPAKDEEPVSKTADIRQRYTIDMRGKDYLTVQGRVLLFREKYPMGSIVTRDVFIDAETAIIQATISVDGNIIATGHGRATEASTKSLGGRYVEKAETAAIGRALALAGFGTDDSLDDSDYLSDSPVERR